MEEVAPAAEEAVAPAAVAAVAGADDGVLAPVMSGDRSLQFFGSQTGNAAGLAEKTAKMAELRVGTNSNRHGWIQSVLTSQRTRES